MLRLLSWHQSAGTRHHPPPRQVACTARKERAYRTGRPGVSSFDSDLSIGHHRSNGELSENPAHGVIEPLTFHRLAPIADYEAIPATNDRVSGYRRRRRGLSRRAVARHDSQRNAQ